MDIGVDQAEIQEFMQQSQKTVRFQKAISELTGTCWVKCVRDPSGALSAKETKCVDSCAGRYLDSHQVVMDLITAKAAAPARSQ
mmetsp:Transcript_12137/g.13660  ORF Transcript_12137/g.13660 Transcript_12137/m.13660 type:complete len:84 (+) Transcript_12137:30-281(+)